MKPNFSTLYKKEGKKKCKYHYNSAVEKKISGNTNLRKETWTSFYNET